MTLADWLEDLDKELRPHFKPAILQRKNTVFRFLFDNGDPFFLETTDNNFSFREGGTSDATLTLYVENHDTCRELLSGSMDGMSAFMENRYRADGNIVLSQLLLYTFKSDRPTIAYEVKD